MTPTLRYRFRLFHHFFLSRSKFEIHSPFVYKIYSEIIKDKTDLAEYYPPIEKKSKNNSALAGKDYRLLFRLSRYFKPKTILVLGKADRTCVSYVASGFPGNHMITIDDNTSLNDYSGVFDLVLVLGDLPGKVNPDYFSRVMQHIHNDSVLIFCNIHSSKEMQEVWSEIKELPSVTLTIDLFSIGLVFRKEELTKEDFILRY